MDLRTRVSGRARAARSGSIRRFRKPCLSGRVQLRMSRSPGGWRWRCMRRKGDTSTAIDPACNPRVHVEPGHAVPRLPGDVDASHSNDPFIREEQSGRTRRSTPRRSAQAIPRTMTPPGQCRIAKRPDFPGRSGVEKRVCVEDRKRCVNVCCHEGLEAEEGPV